MPPADDFACSFRLDLVDETGARRHFHRGRQRTIFGAAGARKLGNLVQMVLRLVAVALFELPQAVILPGLDVVRIGLQRALVPDLRELVVAELAIGVTDQIGDAGAVVMTERLQLIDRGGVIVLVVDRGVGGAIAGDEFRAVDARALVVLLLALGGRRRIVVAGGIGRAARRPLRWRTRPAAKA